MDFTLAETDEFTEGFVKNCFDRGFSEEQTSEMLKAARLVELSNSGDESFNEGIAEGFAKAAGGFSGFGANGYRPSYMGSANSEPSSKPTSSIYSVPKHIRGSAGGGNSSTSTTPGYGPLHGLNKSRAEMEGIDKKIKELRNQMSGTALGTPRGYLENSERQREIRNLTRSRDKHSREATRLGGIMRKDQDYMYSAAARDMNRANRMRSKMDSRFRFHQGLSNKYEAKDSWGSLLQYHPLMRLLGLGGRDVRDKAHNAVSRGEDFNSIAQKAQEALSGGITAGAYR